MNKRTLIARVSAVWLCLGLFSCGDAEKPTTSGQPNNDETRNNKTNNGESNNGQSNNETNQTCIPSAGGIEICDGLDNDCNGLVDDSAAFDNLGESCSVGVGACAAEGVYECSITKTASECGAVEGEPTTEVCDSVDNDCDGEVDEGFGLGETCSAGSGACANDGVVVCMEDGTSACNAVAGVEGAPELCNGMDDDCDGDVDEDFPTLGQPCAVGVGACAATGVYVCSGDELGVVCSATAGTPGTELCDGEDNDCDGVVDEGFNVGQACTAGLGLCVRSGQVQCETDATSACNAVAGTPTEGNETTCDGLDNDCDGLVDENCDEDNDGYCKAGFTRVGSPAVCPLGGNDCDDSNAAINPGATEVCDGVDNNCSGTMDVGAVDTNTYYLDCDGDGFAASSANSQEACSRPANSMAQSFCGLGSAARWVTLVPNGSNIDCQDQNANVRPNQSSYFSTPIANPPTAQRNYDYNCNGTNEHLWTNRNVSTTASCSSFIDLINGCGDAFTVRSTTGWTANVFPGCGSSGEFTYCRYTAVNSVCQGTRVVENRTQVCR